MKGRFINILDNRDEESEVMVNIPVSLLKELNVVSGGKLVEESEPASVGGFSAAALGRSDRMTCTKFLGRSDYRIKLVMPVSAHG